MDEQAWRELLTRWNADLCQTVGELEYVPADIVASGWQGRPGATEQQIQAAEARLGRSLPPSY